MAGALLIAQYALVIAESDELDTTPLYRAPIAYQKKNWSLAEAGWGDTECLEYLRFSQGEIRQLIQNLGLAEWVNSEQKVPGGYARSEEQGFCMLLYRLATPGRLKDMMQVFVVSRSQICCIVNDLGRFLYERYREKLLWDSRRLSLDQLNTYVQAIDDTVGESTQTWGFIDGTVRPVARPTEEQQRYYSGHKGYHGIKYQSIVTPDGLISSLYGPELGPKGDWKVWQESEIEERLRHIFTGSNNVLYLYGDPAYAPSYGIRGPYRAGRLGLTPEQEAFNVVMSKYRIVVEWGFGNILNQFTSGEWKRMQKTGLSPVSINYMISVLLYNCQTCLRQRNQIRDHFGNRVHPPSLETYLSLEI